MYYRKAKYHNKKVEYDGQTFDSQKEMHRYAVLRLLEKDGHIKDLKRQVKFVLIPAQREPDTTGPKGGKIKGKLIEREVAYIADFTYTDTHNGKFVVEDTKGMRTKEYIIKRKMMLFLKNIKIKEI